MMIKFLLMMLVSFNLCAATVWTEQIGERYYTYNTTPTKPTQKLVRVLVANVDSVNPAWVKIGDEFLKQVSQSGAVRYVPAPLPDMCVATFTCHAKFGWIVNISEDTVFGQCKAIKILNEQVVMYDNRVADSGCPTVIK